MSRYVGREKEYLHEYYLAHKEKHKRQRHENYMKNREKALAQSKKYREANKEKKAARDKLYVETHREQVKARQRKWREKNKEKLRVKKRQFMKDNREKYREKNNVRKRTRGAIKRGELIPQPCEICGETRVEAHHVDYNQPFRIMWLCKVHHTEWHINNKAVELDGNRLVKTLKEN